MPCITFDPSKTIPSGLALVLSGGRDGRIWDCPARSPVPSIAAMQIRIANAPTSWGVEDPEDGANPRWERLLSDIADAGYDGTELGPLGYLPDDPASLRSELADRGLELVGGYVFEPLHTRRRAAPDALEVARPPASCWPPRAPSTS